MLTKCLFILKTRIDSLCKEWAIMHQLSWVENSSKIHTSAILWSLSHLEKWCTVFNVFASVSVSYFCASTTTFHDLLFRKYITLYFCKFLSSQDGVEWWGKNYHPFSQMADTKTFFCLSSNYLILFHFSITQAYKHVWKF